MKPFLQITVISAICVVGYFGLRAIPVYNCTFLHASPPLRTESTDNPEFCEVDSNRFIDLSRTRFAVQSDIQATDNPDLWQLNLSTLSKRPIQWEEIAITHTKKIHLLIIDESLGTYHHVHPQPTSEPGIFHFPFTPVAGKYYRLIAEFVPIRTQTQVIAENRFPAAIQSTTAPVDILPTAMQASGNRLRQQHGDFLFELVLPFSGLQANQDNEVLLRISANGNPVPLEEIMGSYGHLVAFDYSGKGFAHFHPILPDNTNPTLQNANHPALPFSFGGMNSGDYRLWVQVKLDGQECFVPFDFSVASNQTL